MSEKPRGKLTLGYPWTFANLVIRRDLDRPPKEYPRLGTVYNGDHLLWPCTVSENPRGKLTLGYPGSRNPRGKFRACVLKA